MNTEALMSMGRDLALWLAESVGIWKILEKCGIKGWWALIPGFRMLRLGECAHREHEGRVCLVLEIVFGLAGLVLTGDVLSERYQILVSLLGLFLIVTGMLYTGRIGAGLCRTFGVRRYWVPAWIFLPTVPALVWGFGKNYQPVDRRLKEGGSAEGSGPEEIAVLSPEDAKAAARLTDKDFTGLSVWIREREISSFNKKRVLLKDISLAIPKGSMVLLLGGSGSGKTVLVNAITGYEQADADIVLNGVNIYRDYSKMKHRIGFVPQQDLMRMNDTVIHTLEDAAALRLPVEIDHEETKRRLNSVMDTLGLQDGNTDLVAKKSGGRKKRISIGMELIADPELFILDEPDSGLDGVIARELFTRLREEADGGRIVMVITHTPDRVIDLFDKVIVLARDSGRVGRLAFYGSPAEAREFFGKETMEDIVRAINRKGDGGEGRADEFIGRFAALRTAGKGGCADEQ